MSGLDIEGVLAAHFGISLGATGWRCSGCDMVIVPLMASDQTSETRESARHAHVAAVLREQVVAAQAEAWSEGYGHGVEDMTGTETLTVVRRNPYRATDPAPARVPSEEG